METPFNIDDAHINLKNLTPELALRWVKIATDDYFRRMKLGATEEFAKSFAKRRANTEIMGRRPYEV